MDIPAIIKQMTLKEKIAFCTGFDFWHTKEIRRLGVKQIKMSDGPHGLRCQPKDADQLGINQSLPATCFPTAVTAAASWNAELYAKEGAAIGEEALGYGVSIVLGPGCNIKRDPRGGRNFEYISEDPFFAGKMAAAFIRGQKSVGAMSSLKHFAVNSQEYKRQNGDSLIDERTLREIYLTPFEIAVKEAAPATVMCAYNKVNGVHCSDSKRLLTDILRDEWGFDGAVITDWGAMNDRIACFEAGCDLNMPGGSTYMDRAAEKAVKKGSLDEAKIDTCVERILRLVEKSAVNGKNPDADFDAHHALARQIAEQGAVLLKNNGILPLAIPDIALFGSMAKEMRYQGSGSSHINPVRTVALTDAMPDTAYYPCGDANGNVSEEELKLAAEAAAKHPVAVVCVGLPDAYESEAFDRAHIRLPDGHNALVEAVAANNPNTVVVLFGGSAMEIPWADRVAAILYMGLPGQPGGEAAANLLTGKANPCGKLTETWPLSYDDAVSSVGFGLKNPEYREGIYVGYRYYDKAEKAVRYPFGYGLSYTKFLYRDLAVSGRTVTAVIENTGDVRGAEVVQLYVAPPQNGIYRPRKELKGFARVELDPGEHKSVTFELDDRSFAVWQDGWKIPGGSYTVLVGASSRDIRLQTAFAVAGETVSAPVWQRKSWYETLRGKPSREEWEKLMGGSVPHIPEPKKGEFTMDSTCVEMLDSSWAMKLQYKISENVIAKDYGGKKDLSNPSYRMMLTCATDCPMRSVVINGKGMMPEFLARTLLHIANGHYGKAILSLFGRKK